MTENLKALLHGRGLEAKEDGLVCVLKGVSLGFPNAPYEDADNISLELLEKMFIPYVNPLDAEVTRLNAIIASQNTEIARLNKPTEKRKHKTLNKATVEEIESIIRDKPQISRDLISSTYGVSQTTVSRVATGVHPKSSSKHQAWVKAGNAYV